MAARTVTGCDKRRVVAGKNCGGKRCKCVRYSSPNRASKYDGQSPGNVSNRVKRTELGDCKKVLLVFLHMLKMRDFHGYKSLIGLANFWRVFHHVFLPMLLAATPSVMTRGTILPVHPAFMWQGKMIGKTDRANAAVQDKLAKAKFILLFQICQRESLFLLCHDGLIFLALHKQGKRFGKVF